MTGIAAIRESSLRASLDASGYTTGARQVDQANDEMRRSGDQVVTTQQRVTRSFETGERSIERLERKYRTASAAQRDYDRDVDRVTSAVDRGVITQERANTILTAAQQRLDRATTAQRTYAAANRNGVTALNALAGANDNVAASSQRLRGGVQNAAFQVGDFFVQVGAGTSATRALGQQLPQLLGGFGAFGAAAGAAAAAMGALIPALFSSQEGFSAAEAAAESYAEALDDLGETADDVREAIAAMDTVNRAAQERRVLLGIEENEAALRSLREQIVDTIPGLERMRTDLENIRLTPGPLDQATRELRDFQQSLIIAVEGLESGRYSAAGFENVLDSLTDQVAASENLTNVFGNRLDSLLNPAFLELTESAGDVEGNIETLNEALAILQGELPAVATETEDTARATRRAATATDDFAESYQRLLERLNPGVARQRELEESLGLLHEAYNRGIITLGQYATLEERVRAGFDDQADAAERSGRRIERAGVTAASAWAGAFTSAANQVIAALSQMSLGVGTPNINVGSLASGIQTTILQDAFSYINPFSNNFSFDTFFSPGTVGTSLVTSGFGEFLGLSSNAFGNTASNFFSYNVPTPTGSFLAGGLNNFSSPFAQVGSFASNLLLNSILGDRGVGSQIGSTIGGIAGSFTPLGPAGSIIGSIAGNLLGGLFGGSRRPPDSTAAYWVDLAGGALNYGGGKNATSEQQQALQVIGNELLQFQQLLDSLGGEILGSGLVGVGLSGKYGDFITINGQQRRLSTRNDPDALRRRLFGDLRGGIQVDDPFLQGVVGRSESANFGDLTAELTQAENFFNTYEEMVARATGTETELALERTTEAWAKVIEQAKDYELALDPLIKLRDEELEAIKAQTDAREAAAREVVQLDSIAAGRTLRNVLDAQSLSATSSLGAADRLTEAQRQFEANMAAVRGGDLGQTGAVAQSFSTLLALGRDFYGPTTDFALFERGLRSNVASLGIEITSEESVANRVVDALAQADQSAARRDATRDQLLADLADEIRTLARRQAA